MQRIVNFKTTGRRIIILFWIKFCLYVYCATNPYPSTNNTTWRRDTLLRDMRITKKSMDNYERMKYRSWRTWIPSSKCSTSKKAKKSLSILSHLVKENLSKNLNYWGMHPVARVSLKYQNIRAFYTTTCFRLTVTMAFALLYIWLNRSVDILVTAFKYILCCKSLEDGHWSGPEHVSVESAQ
jgi:hypothetical protein